MGCYLSWRIVDTLPIHSGMIAMVFGLLLLVAEIVGFVEAMILYWSLTIYQEKEPRKTIAQIKEYPDVDIFIATYNEPYEILYKTINGCLHMEYPKEKLHSDIRAG